MKTNRNPKYHPEYSLSDAKMFWLFGAPSIAGLVGVVGFFVLLFGIGTGWWSVVPLVAAALTWAPLGRRIRLESHHEAAGMTSGQRKVYDAFWELSAESRAQLTKPTKERLDSLTDDELWALRKGFDNIAAAEEQRADADRKLNSLGKELIAETGQVRAAILRNMAEIERQVRELNR